MTFEEALREELAKVSGLNNKVFPLTAPEKTPTPYLIYVSSEGRNEKYLEGYGKNIIKEVEINIIESRYSTLKSLAKLVKTQIENLEQTNLTTNIFIEEINFDNFSPDLYEREVHLYRKVIPITIFLKEA